MSGLPHDGTDMSHGARVVRYGEVSTALALLSDRQLGRIVDAAPAIGSGIGGTSALLDIADTSVFVKRMPLTDLEREPDNVMSTANLFALPTFCHYGVVLLPAAGFGAWRELAANTMTTNWVLTKQSEAFALMYHWRVLPGAPPPADEHVVGIAAPDTGGPVERYDYIRRCAAGAPPTGAPEPFAELISRYAPVAAVMNDFYWNFFGVSRATPYPAQEIMQAMTLIAGFAPVLSPRSPAPHLADPPRGGPKAEMRLTSRTNHHAE